MGHKVVALVRFNDGLGIVLENKPDLKYTKYGNTIIGTDGTFCSCYYYEKPCSSFSAFGGRKFDLELTDGTIEHCEGQWWDGMTEKAIEVLGGKPVSGTAQDYKGLQDCYVFIGYKAIKEKWEQLINSYKGIIWDYWDFDAMISNNPYRRKKLPHFRKYRRRQNRIANIFSKHPQ